MVEIGVHESDIVSSSYINALKLFTVLLMTLIPAYKQFFSHSRRVNADT